MDDYPDNRAAWVKEFETYGLYTLVKLVHEHMLSCRSWMSTNQPFMKALDLARRTTSPDLLTYYLGRISPRLFTAFILGKATAWSHQDHAIESLLQQHSLKQAPMVYINVVCRPKYSPGPGNLQPDRFAGYSVSVKQLEKVLETMRQYINTADSSTVSLAHDVDCAIQKNYTFDASKPSSCVGGRKFLPSPLAVDRIRMWTYQVERKVVKPAQRDNLDTPERLEEPMEWCFQEIGFSRSGLQRASHHTTQEATNYLLGLFYATLQYCFQDSFELRQYRWSYVGEPEHAGFLEIVGSLVNGTYGLTVTGTPLGFGLNPSLAGNVSMTGPKALTDPKLQPGFRFAQQELAASAAWKEHLDFIKTAAELVSGGLDKKEELVRKKSEIELTRNKKQKLSLDAQQEVKSNLLSAVGTLRTRSNLAKEPQPPSTEGVIVKRERDEHSEKRGEST